MSGHPGVYISKIKGKPTGIRGVIFFIISFTLSVGLYGCSDDSYTAEKEMWYAQKAAKEIMANPGTAPPGQVETVVNKFRKIIQKHPDWPGIVKVQWGIVQLYISNKDYKKAETEMEEIIKQHSEDEELCAQVQATIGSLYEIQDDWEKAFQIYNEIIRKYPYTSQGLAMPLYIADKYRRSIKNFLQAEAAYREAINRYQSIFETNSSKRIKVLSLGLYIKTHSSLATLYEQQDRWPDALAILNQIMSEHPYSRDGLEIPLYIANHYKTVGKEVESNEALGKALKYYQDMYEQNEGNPLGLVVLNLITTTYLNQKNWTKAVETQEKIVEKYPDSPELPLSLLNIGLLYEQALKDKPKAISAYETLVKKYPKHRLASETKKRIEQLKKETPPENKT